MHTCSMYAVLPVDLLLILSISAKEPSPGALCLRLSSSEERQYREKQKQMAVGKRTVKYPGFQPFVSTEQGLEQSPVH